RVDLAAVECLALVCVADDLVGSVELRKTRRGFRIVLVGIGMQFLREPTIGALDVALARTLGNPQNLIGVAHLIQTPVKSPARRQIAGDSIASMWGSAPPDATRCSQPKGALTPLIPAKAGIQARNFRRSETTPGFPLSRE